MKNLIISLLLLVPVLCFGQQTLNKSIIVDSITRTYILYVPASYIPGNDVPILLSFHGYTETANFQMVHRNFRPIADTAVFLIAYPQGTLDNAALTHWNVGLGTSTVDDVNFINVLLDSISAEYSIDHSRIYSAGYSNGGHFSIQLGCDLSHRIAAFASVGGTFNKYNDTLCHPERPIPFMQIHGTMDNIIPYNGNGTYKSIPSLLEFWTDYNATEPTPVITTVPDINSFDNSTAELHAWLDGINGVEVQHYKIIGGGHNWPGSATGGVGNFNKDIKASEKIWQFFSRFDLEGAITGTDDNLLSPQVEIFPNPMNTETTIGLDRSYTNLQVNLFNSLGQLEDARVDMNGEHITLYRNSLPEGLHYVSISNNEFSVVAKIMIVD